MKFTIRLAGRNVGICSIYDEVYKLCYDYMTDCEPDIIVSVTPLDIESERKKNILEAQTEGITPIDYPASYLETLAVYRKIVVKLLQFDAFLLHGAVVAVGSKAWLFTAPSGTGKTTHIRLWLENIPDSYVVNGDKPLICVSEDIIVYGTPWAGKEGMQKNIGVELCGIVLLERGADNLIERISFSQAFPTLVQQSYRPGNKNELEKTLKLIKNMGERLPFYRLQCNMLPQAAITAYEVLCEWKAQKDKTHE